MEKGTTKTTLEDRRKYEEKERNKVRLSNWQWKKENLKARTSQQLEVML